MAGSVAGGGLEQGRLAHPRQVCIGAQEEATQRLPEEEPRPAPHKLRRPRRGGAAGGCTLRDSTHGHAGSMRVGTRVVRIPYWHE